MKRLIDQFLLAALFVNLALVAEAQVTIGSDVPPNPGSILDIKERNSTNTETSNKGLGAPRVNLTDMTKLYPMFENDPDYINNTDGKQDRENALHTGLLVYNINENYCEFPPYKKGMYVWNGEKWEYLGVEPKVEILVFNDQDGNEFKARRFGNAGIWMLENLRAITYANGSEAPTLSAQSSSTSKYYCYPAPYNNVEGIRDGTLTNYFDQQPSMGLLYNPAAALNGENTSSEDQEQVPGDTPGDNEVESIAPNGYIQGICPDGWHIPSDREWNQLEKEIYNSPYKYSLYSNKESQKWVPSQWDPAWETYTSEVGQYRGSSTGEGHGWAMLTSCPLLGSPFQGEYKGRSLPSYLGGFDLLPIGISYSGEVAYGDSEYGSATYLFTSSRNSSLFTWFRAFGAVTSLLRQRVDRHRYFPGGIDTFMSVRCKKNE